MHRRNWLFFLVWTLTFESTKENELLGISTRCTCQSELNWYHITLSMKYSCNIKVNTSSKWHSSSKFIIQIGRQKASYRFEWLLAIVASQLNRSSCAETKTKLPTTDVEKCPLYFTVVSKSNHRFFPKYFAIINLCIEFRWNDHMPSSNAVAKQYCDYYSLH